MKFVWVVLRTEGGEAGRQGGREAGRRGGREAERQRGREAEKQRSNHPRFTSLPLRLPASLPSYNSD